MVEQIERNHFSNSFDYFQALIKEMKSSSLIATQCLKARTVKHSKAMDEQAKAIARQAKVIVEERK